ncbi:MAG TPA: hypothetical protein PLE61_15310 [Vicinamibacterales bacterium]|nr:hypothetical protein [Vicinamibacterales bacterium]
MAHGTTGNAARVVAGGVERYKVQNWKSEVSAEEVNDTGAGDAWRGRLPTVKDWTFTGQCIRPATGTVSMGTLVGTEIAVVGYETASVIGFQGTGLCTKWGRDVKIGENIVNDFEVKCSGTAPAVY